MPSCASIEPLITPFVDGQLPAVDAQAVETHIRLCAPCRSRVVAERSVSELLRTRRQELCGQQAPSTLRARCRSQCDQARVTPLASRSRWPGGAPAAVAADDGGRRRADRRERRRLSGDRRIDAGHRCRADGRSCEMLHDERRARNARDLRRRAYARWQSGFGWDAHLPEHPEQADLELVGSRPCLYERGKIAHIMYRHHGVPVSVYMLPGTERSGGIQEDFRARSGHLVGWPSDVRADRSRPTRRSRADGDVCSGLAQVIGREPVAALARRIGRCPEDHE